MKKFIKKLMKKTEGFTLVELIVVIAILGILAGVAVPAYNGYLTKANEAGDVVALDAIKTAAQAYNAQTGAVSSIAVTSGTDGVVTKIVVNSTTVFEDKEGTTNDVSIDDFMLFLTGDKTDTSTGLTLKSDTYKNKTVSWSGAAWA